MLRVQAKGITGSTGILNHRIGRFALAVRLATGSTGPNRMVWVGEPSMVHIEMPEAHPQYEETFLASYWRRIAVLRPEDLPGLDALVSLIERAQHERGKQDAGGIRVSVALGRFSRTFPTSDWREVVLDLGSYGAGSRPRAWELVNKISAWPSAQGLPTFSGAATLLEPMRSTDRLAISTPFGPTLSTVTHGSRRARRTSGKHGGTNSNVLYRPIASNP